MANSSNNSTTTPPTPAQVHASWVEILSKILALTAALAPAVAAPFASAKTETVIASESEVAGALAQALAPAA